MSTQAILLETPHPLLHPSLILLRHESALLADNPLGDPALRHHPVVLPPSFEPRHKTYPLILVLPGYSGTVQGAIMGSPFQESLPARLSRLMTEGTMPEALFVFVDAWTALGGSQFVDSPAVGKYASWIMTELVPAARSILPTNGRLGLMGKSSGGFGAVHLAMAFAGQVDGVLAIAPDGAFETSCPPEFVHTFRILQRYERSIDLCLAGLRAKPKWSPAEFSTMITLAMAACYSASADNWAIPFDLKTGERVDSAWRQWLAFDPVQRLPAEKEGLAALRYLALEAGNRDEHGLDLAVRQMSERLGAAGVSVHEQYYDAGHRGLDFRYDEALPPLVEALS